MSHLLILLLLVFAALASVAVFLCLRCLRVLGEKRFAVYTEFLANVSEAIDAIRLGNELGPMDRKRFQEFSLVASGRTLALAEEVWALLADASERASDKEKKSKIEELLHTSEKKLVELHASMRREIRFNSLPSDKYHKLEMTRGSREAV